jgi:hypothetical protein
MSAKLWQQFCPFILSNGAFSFTPEGYDCRMLANPKMRDYASIMAAILLCALILGAILFSA